ncbi:spore cortex-lytic enzyme, lytic transglycosylase sleb [hydrocarbon metagenome]|uniref:Spore cortex-lytic enzyme, lytic transglycosylase sleb n=1 Tax=hydrocarbon metagenome TaxID=938273 RepID=A0A0W8E8A0_9ZZZZ
MREKKMVAAVLLIVLLGLIGLNIPTKAFDQVQRADQQLAANNDINIVTEDTIEPDTDTSKAVNKPVSNASSDTDDKAPTPSRSATIRYSHNLDSLAKVVYGEARGESFTGQVAIAAVVLNRVESDKFGNTVNEVIFEPGAFTAVSDGQYYMQPDEVAYRAAQSAIDGWDPTNNAIYYWNPVTATNKWVWSRPITTTIGKHVFAH